MFISDSDLVYTLLISLLQFSLCFIIPTNVSVNKQKLKTKIKFRVVEVPFRLVWSVPLIYGSDLKGRAELCRGKLAWHLASRLASIVLSTQQFLKISTT